MIIPLENEDSELLLHDYQPEIHTMKDDVLQALSRPAKSLPSQYLYDELGALLFEEICDTQEYYLTRTETEILRDCMPDIRQLVGPNAMVVEPGSGSGIKTQLLLEGLESPAAYVPIDVARDQLISFAKQVDSAFANLEVLPVCADFTTDYDTPTSATSVGKQVVFFPGSTIGNFLPTVAVDVLLHLADHCGRDGGVLIGVDLDKDKSILEPAYDDKQGISRAFALNYLTRMNRELDCNFDVSQFDYDASYNPDEGRIEMALVSLTDQLVVIDDTEIEFKRQELVRTEVAYKFSLEGFSELAAEAGLDVKQVWTDNNNLFSIQYLEPQS